MKQIKRTKDYKAGYKRGYRSGKNRGIKLIEEKYQTGPRIVVGTKEWFAIGRNFPFMSIDNPSDYPLDVNLAFGQLHNIEGKLSFFQKIKKLIALWKFM